MKSYTDIEQSKKLAEILSPESADMMYHSLEYEYGDGAFIAISKVITNGIEDDDFYYDDIPCWSLAALLNILPNYHVTNNGITGVVVWSLDTYSKEHDNPVDACYEIILKLNELKML